MGAQPTVQIPADVLLQRIDAMMRELLGLRQLVAAQVALQAHPREPNLVAQLVGCLGQGSWEEYQDDIEWEQFSL